MLFRSGRKVNLYWLPANYVRGTFGWGGVVGGFIFGLGAMFAGGCGSGTLWRVGEGQVKLTDGGAVFWHSGVTYECMV